MSERRALSASRLRASFLPLVTAGALALVAGRALAAGGLAFDRPSLQASQALQVSIPSVKADGALPANYTLDGRNVSPAISWTAGPPSTRGYVLVVQDPDARTPEAAVHWLVYALPAEVLSLPRGLHNVAEPTHPLGSAQGRNDHGSLGYSGPHPPVGDPPHHYHFQVFALDRAPRVKPGADLAALELAMDGHVTARGELVATYAAPTPARGRPGQATPATP